MVNAIRRADRKTRPQPSESATLLEVVRFWLKESKARGWVVRGMSVLKPEDKGLARAVRPRSVVDQTDRLAYEALMSCQPSRSARTRGRQLEL